MIQKKLFNKLAAWGLLLCLVLYAEETVHFLHYGWKGPDNLLATRDVSDCRPVPGKNMDMECPVRGYGWARVRYKDHDGPNYTHMKYIDRIE